MITKCLSELLHNHDCVVVPELGAFIAHECPASLDYVNHRFTPPHKEIVFNRHLLNNDGLLVPCLAEKEGVAEAAAANEIHAFAMTSLGLLEAKQSVKLNGIGELVKHNDEIFFHRDEETNFLDASFGLSSFSVQPIYRAETYKNISMKITAEQAEGQASVTSGNIRARKNRRWVVPVTSTLIGMALIFLGAQKKSDPQRLASIVPLSCHVSEPTELVAEPIENQETVKSVIAIGDIAAETGNVQESKESTVESSDELAMDEAQAMTVEKTENKEQQPVIEEIAVVNHYFIIGGSFNTAERAAVCLKQLQKEGFENAEILACNDNGNWRVAFEAYPTKDEAMPRLDAIRNEFNEQAWLLYQK